MASSPEIYLIESALVTPLGYGTADNMEALLKGQSGIDLVNDPTFHPHPLHVSAMKPELLHTPDGHFLHDTRFDTLLLQCAAQLKQRSPVDLSAPDVLLILSTTKGNISLMDSDLHDERLHLHYSAEKLREYLGNPHTPLIISNACISGISAFIVAARYLKEGLCKHAVVMGCDVLSRFVISGFQSFHAISKEPCRPFDLHRHGISMGEAAAAVILSADQRSDVEIGAGWISNDANHISGPSRTGEELAFCIRQSLQQSELTNEDIGFICAHGTATPYNDEMESLAIEAAGLSEVPLFSLKGHYGHTLGAAGVLELVITAECLKREIILPNLNFTVHGVSGKVFVNRTLQHKRTQAALKTGSGFGGCNAALVLKRSKTAQ